MPAQAGHGVRWRVTLDYASNPNTFTDIDGLRGDQEFDTTRDVKEVTPHSRGGAAVTVDEYVVSPVLKRGEINFELNWDKTDADHIALRQLVYDGTFCSIEKLGPGGVPYNTVTPEDTDDSILQSGFFHGWTLNDGEYENERRATFKFRPSGPYRIDGVLIS
jgi:hypothetical protein